MAELARTAALTGLPNRYSFDKVLREFARRLLGLVRGTDFVGRLAGDEFVVVLEGLHAASEAEAMAGKIIEVVNGPFATSIGELSIGTSIGIAVHPGNELGGDELLSRADQALYLAKGGGRN